MATRPAAQLGRWIALGAVVVGLVVLAGQIAAWVVADPEPAALVLARAEGAVRVRSGSTERVVGSGDLVEVRDTLSTGADGGAVLSAGGSTELRVGPATTVQVVAADAEKVSVELEQGRLVADVPAGGRAVRVGNAGRTITTADGEVAVAVEEGVFSFEVRRGEALADGVEGVDVASAPAAVASFPDGTVHLGEIPDSLLLEIAWPQPRTREANATVRGRTQPGARVTIRVSDRTFTARASPDGSFVVPIVLVEGATPVVALVEDPFGRVVEQQVTLELDTRPPVISVERSP